MLPRSAPCGFKASQTLGAKCRAHVPASWRFLLMAAPRGAVLLPVPTSLPSRWKGRLGWDPPRVRVFLPSPRTRGTCWPPHVEPVCQLQSVARSEGGH